MSILRVLLACACLILLMTISSQAKDWRGIIPLHSSRADVERLLGPALDGCKGLACIYDSPDERVFILYANGLPCDNGDASSAWRVPRDTVIEIGVHFKIERKLSDLGLDLTNYERVADDELPGWIYYYNKAEGIRIEGGTRTISSITYFQSAKDQELSCRKDTKRRCGE